jgi:hypothetical protein
MSDEAGGDSDDRMGRADRIRNTREGRRDQSRRSRSHGDANESEDQQTTSQDSQTSQRAQTSQKEQTSQNSQRSGEATTTQPVKDRPHRTVYLPSTLDDEFDSQIDRIQYEAKHETDGEKVKLAKNRHVYPLLVHLGLEQASSMTIDELLTVLSDTEMLDSPNR